MARRVAIITPAKFPGSAGDTANFIEIMDQLIHENIQPLLICPKNQDLDENGRLANYKIIRIPYVPPRMKELKNKIGIWQRIKLLNFLLIEAVVVIWTLNRTGIRAVFMRHSILTIQLPFILKIMGVKIIADGELIEDSLKSHATRLGSKLLNRYERSAIRKYSYFKVSTKAHANNISSVGYPEDHILLIPVSINIDRIPRYEIDEIPPHTFGYFGGLEKWQGIDILIEGFAILKKKIPSVKLYIIGEGSVGAELKKIVDMHDLSDNVVFVGSISRECLWEQYFNRFRVVVIPRPLQHSSIDYILPIKLVESLAAAKPIIAMDVPVMREIPTDAIMLVSPSNPNQLAECMEKLSSDPALLKEFSKNARSVASNYDIKLNIRRLISTLCGE